MPKRIQLRRTKGWRLPPGAVSIARPHRLGNPYVVGSGQVGWTGPMLGSCAGDYNPKDERLADLDLGHGLSAAEAVYLYRRDLEETVSGAWAEDSYYDPIRAALEAVRGKDLACWCPLTDAEGRLVPCHVDVVLELANRPRP